MSLRPLGEEGKGLRVLPSPAGDYLVGQDDMTTTEMVVIRGGGVRECSSSYKSMGFTYAKDGKIQDESSGG
ncbi:hypothetical protein UY3_04570 [Chelonia mydas]|uniref:Uncharacterized protein n=1 Tax=Chelonia mydas TaxID=8469 RepID=M7CBZ0_CHEMY|nr:hypothetical protein UY3_04570 [Chelonia mydas]